MNIAVVGGSITEGAGAYQYKNSYTYKLQEYLEKQYDNVVIKNLGSGGTASQFALFRLKRDLEGFKPDCIFIEFGVNDRIYPSFECNMYFEGLIRECLKITEKIIIIDFPTGMADSCTSIHKRFAYYYNIPLIDVQDEVWRKIGNGEFEWDDISVDNLHPNDRGHNLYCEIITEKLEKIDIKNIRAKRDNVYLSDYKFTNPSIVNYDNKEVLYYGNWNEQEFNLNNKFKKAAVTKDIEDGIIFTFKGTYLSIMHYLTRDSGIIYCKLDEEVFKIDLYMDTDGYFNTSLNIYGLEDREHKLTILVSEDRNENSSGNKAIIGGFLVDLGE